MSHHDHHKFDPARLARLERPERHALMRPRDLLQAAGITEGMTVVDIGCGTGFFTLPAAELVGPTGRVLALDIAPAMLDFLRDRKPPPHVDVLPCDESTFPITDDTADLVVLSLVLHEAVDPHRFLADIARLLRPGASSSAWNGKIKTSPEAQAAPTGSTAPLPSHGFARPTSGTSPPPTGHHPTTPSPLADPGASHD